LNKLQRIEHDGGLFSFLVPEHWEKGIEEDGSQAFWDPEAGSGTLRVSAITAQKTAEAEQLPQLSVLSARGTPTLRDDGVALLHYRTMDATGDEATVMLWWEFAQFVPPCYMRMALFSFTFFANEELEEATQAQIRLLDGALAAVLFGGLQAFER
jgi:hypothetical protein